MKSSHIFRKPACLVEIECRETIALMSNAGTVQGTSFPPTQVPTSYIVHCKDKSTQITSKFLIFKGNLIHLPD